MDLPVLVETCAPMVAASTMHAIIKTESGGNPWAIGDNTQRLARQPVTKEEAIALAKSLIGLGHSIDMGLGQINSKNLARLNLSVDQVFDPCTNLAAASAILGWGYMRATKQFGEGQPALHAALSAYNTGNLNAGFTNGYVNRVLNNSGITVAIRIPGVTAGTVLRSKRGIYVVSQQDAALAYTSPLTAWGAVKTPDKPSDATLDKQVALNPRFSPLESSGFSVAK